MTVSLNRKIARLSPAARKLFERVLDPDNFYKAHAPRVPKAMIELEVAGLVGTMGRVVSIERCYVPRGTRPLKLEKFPRRFK